MRTVLYGLTADPLTKAHKEIIRRLSEDFDKVVVIPTTIRYYKKNEQMFSFNERFNALVKEAEKYNNVAVSDVERNAPDTWRFVDSFKHYENFVKTNPYVSVANNKEELFVAMGSDSFQNFKTWSKWEYIRNHSTIVVFHRPGFEDNFPTDIEYVYYKDMNINVSSTAAREKIKKYMEETDFDEAIDDLTFVKNFDDYDY